MTFFKGKLIGAGERLVLFEALNHVLSVLTRIIELRFSHALSPELLCRHRTRQENPGARNVGAVPRAIGCHARFAHGFA